MSPHPLQQNVSGDFFGESRCIVWLLWLLGSKDEDVCSLLGRGDSKPREGCRGETGKKPHAG